MFKLRNYIKPISTFRLNNLLKRSFCVTSSFIEVQIPTTLGKIRGKWWGPTNERPILGLPGWQDNAGTFNKLAPCLSKNIGFLAIDWIGHGKSNHNPRGVMYVIYDTIIALREIQELMEWENLSFVSHSLGGLSGFFYSSLFPSGIDMHISFDLLPSISQEKQNNISKALQTFLETDKLIFENHTPKLYTHEEAVQFLHETSEKAITFECAKHLLERELTPSNTDSTKYRFNQDPRVTVPTMFLFSQKELITMAKYIQAPLMDIQPLQSQYFTNNKKTFCSEISKMLTGTSRDFVQLSIPGTHYLHLTHPEQVADAVNGFILKHSNKNRHQKENITEKIKLKR